MNRRDIVEKDIVMDHDRQNDVADEGRLVAVLIIHDLEYYVRLNRAELEELRRLEGGDLTVDFMHRLKTRGSRAKTFSALLRELGWVEAEAFISGEEDED